MKAQLALEYMTIFAFAVGVLISVFSMVSGLLPGSAAPATISSSCYLAPNLNCAGMNINSKTGNVTVVFSNNEGASLSFPTNSFVVRPSGSKTEYVGSCVAATPSVATQSVVTNTTYTYNSTDNGNGNSCNNTGNDHNKNKANMTKCNVTVSNTVVQNVVSYTYSNYSTSGTKVICTAQISAALLKPGEQSLPAFSVGYKLCAKGKVCQAELNTTGTATTYVS